jgi:predicted esterase
MSVEYLAIETPTHGRVVIARPSVPSTTTLVAFHGYGQGAEELMSEMKRIPGHEALTLISVQALHRFYARGDERIVASWMTRQDRDHAIVDNLEYVDRAIDHAAPADGRLCVLGFSQGVAMAYRAGVRGRRRVDGIIAVGGDVPPDVKDVPADRWSKVLIAAGATDHWYTPDKVTADAEFLRSHGVAHDVFRYQAGHVFTDDVRAAIASFVIA